MKFKTTHFYNAFNCRMIKGKTKYKYITNTSIENRRILENNLNININYIRRHEI